MTYLSLANYTYLVGQVCIRTDWREKHSQKVRVHEVDIDDVKGHVETPKRFVQLLSEAD